MIEGGAMKFTIINVAATLFLSVVPSAQGHMVIIYCEIATYEISDSRGIDDVFELARQGGSGEIVYSGNSVVANARATFNWSIESKNWTLELALKPIDSLAESLAVKANFHQNFFNNNDQKYSSAIESENEIALVPNQRHIIFATQHGHARDALIVAVVKIERY
jgi:hypothetical protein